jgi:hypothetical protein
MSRMASPALHGLRVHRSTADVLFALIKELVCKSDSPTILAQFLPPI